MDLVSQRFEELSERQRRLLKLMLREETDEAVEPIRPRDKVATDLPLSFAQRGLWFMNRLAPEEAFYNLPSAVRLRGDLDIAAMRRTFQEIVHRHETLRTTFPARDGKPCQVVVPSLALEIPLHQRPDLPPDERERVMTARATRDSLQPFDLETGPLIRVSLYRIDDRDHILLFNMHHIVVDGWSIGVLNVEIPLLYDAFRNGKPSPLPPLPVQFADYALWQRRVLSGAYLEERLAWWRERLEGLPALELPSDRPRPAVQTFAGARQYFGLDAERTAALEALSERNGVTLFQTLLAGFQLLIARYSGQDMIAVGTPMASRTHREIEGLVGFFANTLVLVTDLSGNPPFETLLTRVKETTVGAYAHADVPFELLVEHLNVARDPGRNPIFQVMFSLQKSSVEQLEIPGLEVCRENLDNDTTHFDLEMHLWNHEGKLGGYLSYSKDLFEPETVLRMVGHFVVLLEHLADAPQTPILQLPMLTGWERDFLQGIGETTIGAETPAHLLVAEVCGRNPGAPAVLDQNGNTLLTYAQLPVAAGSLAAGLQHAMTNGERRVGIALPPGPQRVTAVLGVLEAGASVVPVAVGNNSPPAGLLLVDRDDDRYADFPGRVIVVDVADEHTPLETIADLDLTALMMQGSGNPVAVSNRALAQRIACLQQRFNLTVGDRPALHAASDDDFMAVEILWPLTQGAALVCPDDPENIDWPAVFACATHARFHPEKLAELLAGAEGIRGGHIRQILCGGGLLHRQTVRTFQRKMDAELIYSYCPPEAAREVSFVNCSDASGTGVVGAGNRFYLPVCVLDDGGGLAPIGVPGRIQLDGRPTGDRGRLSADGSLELLPPSGRVHARGGRRFNLARIEAVLRAHRAVHDCHARPTETGEIIAYVISGGEVPTEALEKHVTQNLPRYLRPAAIVPVNHFPLNRCGEICNHTLSEVEVVDADLVRRWESALLKVSGVVRLAVTTFPREETTAPVHISDLLPTVERRETRSSPKPAPDLQAVDLPRAFADGGPLHIPADAPRTLSEAFLKSASLPEDRGIRLVQDRSCFLSYARLAERAQHLLAGLQQQGLRPGDRVILQIQDLGDHFAAFQACVLGGIIPVTVAMAPTYSRKSSVVNKLWNIHQLLGNPLVLSNRESVAALASVPALYEADPNGFQVAAVEDLALDTKGKIHPADPKDVVFYQLTSGSTGIPKCIRETHHGIIHHIWGSKQFCDYSEDDITLNWLPMDHVVPILTCHLKDTYLGIRQIVVRTSVILADPLIWLDLMEEHKVTHTWSPNFGFKLVSDALAENPGRNWDLSSLKFAMNAGEQVTEAVVTDFLRRTDSFGIRSQVMQPAFGMAEVCTCMTYTNDFRPDSGVHHVAKDSLTGLLREAGSDEDAMAFVDLGPPMPGVQIRITDTRNRIVPEGVIGRFQIRGEVTTPGYLNNEEANAEAFVGDGWFNSGDLGFIKNGRLSLTGREKEMIIIRGANFYCYEIEDVVNGVPGVTPTFSAACAVDDPTTGTEGLAVFFVPVDKSSGIDTALLQKIKETVARDVGISPSVVLPLSEGEFPKTTSGKIQRTQLKKSLQQGRFQKRLKEVDLALANENTVPPWFHQQVWKLKSAPSAPVEGLRLIFLDSGGLGDNIEGDAVFVEAGRDFTTLEPGRRYAMAPDREDHYETLMNALDEAGRKPAQIIHLWSCDYHRDDDENDRRAMNAAGAIGLTALAACLIRRQFRGKLLVATRNAIAVDADNVVLPEKTALIGLVQTIAAEYPDLSCRLADLEPESVDPFDEHDLGGGDLVIARRAGRRLAPYLAPMIPSQSASDPFKAGGLYLISGGLGGIGVHVAEFLLQHHGANLVLLGRTPLEENETRRTALNLLQAMPGSAAYARVDITDTATLREIVAEAEARTGRKLDGIIHLAGSFAGRLLHEETPETFAETLRAKTEGSRALASILPEGALFLAFGSVNALFGGVAAGAYSTANSYLSGFCASLRRKGYDSRCLAWTMWEEVGMSKGYLMKDRTRARGYHLIDHRRGIASLRAALNSGLPEVIIGLDGANPNIRRYIATGSLARIQLGVFFTADAGDPETRLRRVEMTDRFGTPSHPEFIRLETMPLLETGAPDLQALRNLRGFKSAGAPRVAPRNSLERTIAQAWREVLGIEEVGIHNSFFELGGQSVLLVQVHSKLSRVLNRNFTVVELLRYPTISTLASWLGKETKAKPAYDAAADRAARQKQALKKRVKPRRRPRR
ncbi:MAG: SDR family oxidoreductase [Acidobacteriota bacterium]|nr:SDR family oxidoreductase [Acidobacteriota bacterium]